MKKIIVLFIGIFAATVISAQTKESVFSAMAADMCKEIKEKQSELKASKDIQMDLGLMVMPVFLKYEDDVKKVMPNFDISDAKQVEGLGVEIGKRLISCPEFLSLISSNKDFLVTEDQGVTSLSLEGTLQSVNTGEFTSITVKTSSGKTEKIWWMGYFPGDNKLSDGSLINKTIKLSYTEREVYNASLKDYIKVKVLAGIQ